jgi:phage tail-like protein
MARIDPLRNFRFRLEIDGIVRAGFAEVSGLKAETMAIDYREGTDPPHVRKLSGLTKYSNITLRRGITVGDRELFEWYKAVTEGGLVQNRKRVTIIVQDDAGADQVRFVVNEAWPTKYDAPDLNAKGNEVAIELLELANEGIERVS